MTHKEFFEHNWRLGEIVYVVEQLGRHVEEVDASYPTGRILKTRVCLITKYDYPKNYYYTHQRNRIIMNIRLECDDLEDLYDIGYENLVLGMKYNKGTKEFELVEQNEKFLQNKFFSLDDVEKTKDAVISNYAKEIKKKISEMNSSIRRSKKKIEKMKQDIAKEKETIKQLNELIKNLK